MLVSAWAAAAAVILCIVLAAAACAAGCLALHYRDRLSALDPDGREVYVSYEKPDYSASAGYRLNDLPHSDILIPRAYWLVNGCTAQIEYDIEPSQRAFLRIAKSGRLCCAEAYRTVQYDSTAEYELDGVKVVQQQVTGGFTVVKWSRGGYDFMFYAPQPQMNAVSGCLAAFLRQDAVDPQI